MMINLKLLAVSFACVLGVIFLAPKAKAVDYVDFDFNTPIDDWIGSNVIAEEAFAACESVISSENSSLTYIRWAGVITNVSGTPYTRYVYFVTGVNVDVADLKFYYNTVGNRDRLYCVAPDGYSDWYYAGASYTVYQDGSTSWSKPNSATRMGSTGYSATINNEVYHTIQINVNTQNEVNPVQYVNFKGRTIYNALDELIPLQPVEPLLFNDSAEVSKNSDLGILYEMYDIKFTVENSLNPKFIGKEYSVTLKEVRSDSGYTMLSLQVPALAVLQDFDTDTPLDVVLPYANSPVYGYYTFYPKNENKYDFVDLTLSFASDIDVYDNWAYQEMIPRPTGYPFLLADDTLVRGSKPTLTVNSMRFMYGFNSYSYSNRELTCIDYRANGQVHPRFKYYAQGYINSYSSGAFVYNLGYSHIYDIENDRNLDDDEVDDVSQQGNSNNDEDEDSQAYIPKYLRLPSVTQLFDYNPDFAKYNFAQHKTLFDILLSDYVTEILIMSVTFGILGYVLFGKW